MSKPAADNKLKVKTIEVKLEAIANVLGYELKEWAKCGYDNIRHPEFNAKSYLFS